MKKILSLLLVVCTAFSCCMFFASCDKVDTKAVEKDPYATLTDASANSMEAFFSDDAEIGSIIASALKSGSMSIDFKGNADLLGEKTAINETIYFNQKKHLYVSDTSVKYGEESIQARIFFDKDGIMVKSQDILGSENALSLNFSTLAEQFKGSALEKMLSLDPSSVNEVVKALEMVRDLYTETITGKNQDAAVTLANDIYQLLNQTVSTESIETADSKAVECVVASYTITNQNLKAVINRCVEELNLTGELKSQVKEAVEDTCHQLDDTAAINLTEKIYVNKKSNAFEKISVNGTVVINDGGMAQATVSAEILFNENEIRLTGNVTLDGAKYDADATLTKETSGNNVIYSLKLNAGDGKGATVNLANASYTYNKKSGDLEIKADIYNPDGNERMTFAVDGCIEATKDQATVSFTSAKYMDEKVNFDLSFTFNKKATMPEFPSDAKDIVAMTEDEWDAFAEDFSNNSKINDFLRYLF